MCDRQCLGMRKNSSSRGGRIRQEETSWWWVSCVSQGHSRQSVFGLVWCFREGFIKEGFREGRGQSRKEDNWMSTTAPGERNKLGEKGKG